MTLFAYIAFAFQVTAALATISHPIMYYLYTSGIQLITALPSLEIHWVYVESLP